MLEFTDIKNERIYAIKTDSITSKALRLEDKINQFISDNDNDLTLDFENLTRIDSMSIALLIRIQKKLSEQDRILKLINTCEAIIQVLQIANLDDKITIE